MRRGRRSESRASREARKEFTESVLEREGCEIQDLIPHVCGGGWVDACHVLPKSFIKRETNTWDEADHLAAMWDTTNALKGCRVGHNLFDAASHCGVTIDDLPACVVRFASDYGWRWKLELEYPVRVGERKAA